MKTIDVKKQYEVIKSWNDKVEFIKKHINYIDSTKASGPTGLQIIEGAISLSREFIAYETWARNEYKFLIDTKPIITIKENSIEKTNNSKYDSRILWNKCEPSLFCFYNELMEQRLIKKISEENFLKHFKFINSTSQKSKDIVRICWNSSQGTMMYLFTELHFFEIIDLEDRSVYAIIMDHFYDKLKTPYKYNSLKTSSSEVRTEINEGTKKYEFLDSIIAKIIKY